jgi:hypothetical protein
MTTLTLMGIISTIALFLPISLILLLKLFRQRSFLMLAFYYLLPGVYNLAQEKFIPFPKTTLKYFGIANNLLDAPLMLTFLCLFSYSALMTKRISILIYAFVAYEAIIVAAAGFNTNAITYILGPGILLILALSFILFRRHVKLIITQQKGPGKALMTSSVLLSYTIFGLIYLFYFVLKVPGISNDVFLMYYIVSLLSALLMAAGIWIENKRFQKLNELKYTRKELAAIYDSQHDTAALKSAVAIGVNKF